MRILGIDSGINGGCALYGGPDILTAFDIPTVGEGHRREVDYAGLRDLIWAHRPDVAFIEQITAFMPKDEETGEPVKWGGQSLLRFGGSYYGARAVVGCLNIPLRTLTAAEWKAAFNLRGGKSKKDDARQLVLQRYPMARPLLQFKKDGHRADAILIAVYGMRKMRREGDNLDIPE